MKQYNSLTAIEMETLGLLFDQYRSWANTEYPKNSTILDFKRLFFSNSPLQTLVTYSLFESYYQDHKDKNDFAQRAPKSNFSKQLKTIFDAKYNPVFTHLESTSELNFELPTYSPKVVIQSLNQLHETYGTTAVERFLASTNVEG